MWIIYSLVIILALDVNSLLEIIRFFSTLILNADETTALWVIIEHWKKTKAWMRGMYLPLNLGLKTKLYLDSIWIKCGLKLAQLRGQNIRVDEPGAEGSLDIGDIRPELWNTYCERRIRSKISCGCPVAGFSLVGLTQPVDPPFFFHRFMRNTSIERGTQI